MFLKITLLTLVAFGTAFLVRSLIPAKKICRLDQSAGWRILVALISLFIAGYVFLFYEIFLASAMSSVFVVLAIVLSGGAVFVALVIPFSLKAIEKLNNIAEEERNRSLHDTLTGLPNRKALLQCLEEHTDTQFTLFLIDLNNFKQINDGLGHYMGDLFLISVAKRIQSNLPDTSNIFRLGGDEFSIIVDSIDDEEILSVVDRIHEALSTPIDILSYSMNTSASVGIAKYPQDTQEVIGLLKQSDLAMYHSKKNAQKYTFYYEELCVSSYEKLKLSQRLSVAIEDDEFELYYQPIINARTDKLCALEALIRWPQSDGSIIMPDEFIPMAEKSALINLISEWVIKAAARDLHTLRAEGFTGRIHINLSSKDIQNDTVPDLLDKLVMEGRINPGDFSFEITERDMVEDIDKARMVMKRINELGFSFSVDDFGTGFSSLVLLRELPIDEIKIDRSFVQNFDENDTNLSIICHVLSLAKDLHCSVVAEGVETETIKQRLLELGADLHQGYYYSYPINIQTVISTYKQ